MYFVGIYLIQEQIYTSLMRIDSKYVVRMKKYREEKGKKTREKR